MPRAQNCELCYSEISSLYKFSYGYLYKCKHCGSEFLNANEKFEYNQEYYQSWFCNPNNKIEKIKRTNFKYLLTTYFNSLKNKKLLDIGCATGFLLQEAQSLGVKIYGIDINEWAIQHAKEKLPNARLYCGQLHRALEKKFFSENYFDIVIGTDIIEHISDCRSFLKNVLRALKRGGKAAFTTPYVESLSHRLLGFYWFQYKPEHISFITSKALTLLANEMGFKIETIVPIKKRLSLEYIFNVLQHHNIGFVKWLGLLGLIFVRSLFLSKLQFSFRTGEVLFLISKP